MSRRDRGLKTLLFFSVLCYYLGGYFLINLYNQQRGIKYDIGMVQEQLIPFYPIFIFGYVTLFAVIALTYAGIQDIAYFKKTVKAFYLCVTIHFIIFLILPVEYQLRPVIDPAHGWIYRAVHFYYWLDLPYNCFPSLHTSNAFLCAFLLQKYRPGLGWIFFPAAVLIAFSVVVVKQHYVADVVSGAFVAYLVYRVIWREPKKAAKRAETVSDDTRYSPELASQ